LSVAQALAHDETVPYELLESGADLLESDATSVDLLGGKHTAEWILKVTGRGSRSIRLDVVDECPADETVDLLAVHASAEAADAAGSASYTYWAELAPDSNQTIVQLLRADSTGIFSAWIDGEWLSVAEPAANSNVIELDDDTASDVADVFAESGLDSIDLAAVVPHVELSLWQAAEPEMSWTFTDAAMGTELAEIAVDEQPTSVDKPVVEKTAPVVHARLAVPLALVPDPSTLLDEYLATAETLRAEKKATFAAEDAPAAADAVANATAGTETPDTSDVPPLYLAIVDEADTQAVLELIALVPGTAGSEEQLRAFIRLDRAWVESTELLQQLRSATPPPVVQLDESMYASVLEQVDNPVEETDDVATEQVPAVSSVPATPPTAAPSPMSAPVTASLTPLYGPYGELYTLVAAGGADQNRGNAEELRRYWTHGEGGAKIRWNTDGDWTRCVRQLSKYLGPRAKGYCSLRHHEMTGHWSGDRPGVGTGLSSFFDRVAALVAAAGETPPATADTVQGGARFVIPLVVPEDLESGDGRSFSPGSLTTRELPLPLLWQMATGDKHDGSVVVGRIDSIERVPNGLGNARGVFDTGPYGREAERLVRERMFRGVSGDLDKFTAALADEGGTDVNTVTSSKLRVSEARLMSVTLVPKPAFQECYIELVNESGENVIEDGVYEEIDEERTSAAVVASAAPVSPPKSWFTNPELDKPTPLTVTPEGRVFGHIAAWDVDHIGMPFGTRPPRSKSGYSYFQTGLLKTEEGDDVTVGQLTLAGGHAPLEASASAAVKHYDDTASAVADVSVGEDVFGIWVAGSLRPSVTAEQVRTLRASAPSGDWRPIRGALELVAVCQVNVPGFPIARARVASGQVRALVAAGASVLAHLREGTAPTDEISELNARVSRLEDAEAARLTALAASARARVVAQQTDKLAAQVAAIRERIKPSRDRHAALVAAADLARARVAALRVVPEWEEEKHPRDDKGRFAEVIARLRDIVANDSSDAAPAVQEAVDAMENAPTDDSQAADDAARDVVARLDSAASEAVDDATRATLRQASEAVTEVINGGPESGDSDGVPLEQLPPVVRQLLDSAADRLASIAVPGSTDVVLGKIQSYLKGGPPVSPAVIASFIENYLKQQILPE